jgi:ActR/RegA family two-component response regulator
VEHDYIRLILALCDGNRSKAARCLGIPRRSLQRKLQTNPPRR